MKCFYHKSDLDGHCSGAIIKLTYPQCEMIGVDYGDTLDLGSVEEGEIVYVVDFCFSTPEMIQLAARAKLIWIDHHKSSIERLRDIPVDIKGLREIGKAGCELTWLYLFEKREMPVAVELLGRYDVWDHADTRVLPFQYGVRQEEDTLPGAKIWVDILSPERDEAVVIDAICWKGLIVMKYQQKQDKVYAKGMAFEAKFHGLRAIVMNKAYSNSKVFDEVYNSAEHDIMILFGVKPGEWKYSLYSDKPDVDCSAIAAEYGGGGHRGAAGFTREQPCIPV